jgi:hypothetical protein
MIQMSNDYRIPLLESMLNRYGLLYVCQEPLILFGERSARAESVPKVVGYGDDLGGTYHLRRYGREGAAEDLARRTREAYEILNQLYAPWPAMSPGSHASVGEQPGYRH